jgi:hypothetical protein
MWFNRHKSRSARSTMMRFAFLSGEATRNRKAEIRVPALEGSNKFPPRLQGFEPSLAACFASKLRVALLMPTDESPIELYKRKLEIL